MIIPSAEKLSLYALVLLTGFLNDFFGGMWTKEITELKRWSATLWTVIHGVARLTLIYGIALTDDIWLGIFYLIGLTFGTQLMVYLKQCEKQILKWFTKFLATTFHIKILHHRK